MNGVLHALVRPGEKGWPPAMPRWSASCRWRTVLTLLFIVQLVIMIWKPGI